MSDYFIGVDRGAELHTVVGGTYNGVTEGSSTTSKGIELRWTTTAGTKITTQDLIRAMEMFERYLLTDPLNDLPLDLTT